MLFKEIQYGREVYRIRFYDKNKQRRSIRLGEIGKKNAQAIAARVSHLVDLSAAGLPLDGESSAWLAKIGDDLADKIAGAGLIAKRQSEKLAAFVDNYLASRIDMRPNSVRVYRESRISLVNYFGEQCNLRDIDAGQAEQWRQSLVNAKLAVATISKRVRVARHFFKIALKRGIVSVNPFTDVKAGGERNPSRIQFIDLKTIYAVLNATADPEWQLIIAFSRFLGLRCPSETLSLKWTDINWETNRITVPSPKTEHQDKPFRVVPLFPELKPYLEKAFDNAPEGAVYCIGRYRDARNANLRTQFLKILRRAGVKPWERLFHNMRASRQTELCNRFPSHVVAEWMGNTVDVANKHYLSTTDDHFDQAVAMQGGTEGGTDLSKRGGTKGGTAGESKPSQIVANCLPIAGLGQETATQYTSVQYTPLDSNQ